MDAGGSDKRIAIVGAGVAGLTCSVLFAERGYRTTIIARETGQQTTSAAAAAIWFPYDAEPANRVIDWSLETLDVLRALAVDQRSGVAIVELRLFARSGTTEIPQWAVSLGAQRLDSTEVSAPLFSSGYKIEVPVVDTTVYLDYLGERFTRSGGVFAEGTTLADLEEISADAQLVVNCSGVGARHLANDNDVEPHRGQVVVTAKLSLPYAVVCDDPPLMYAIPRTHDCILGGTNEVSDDLEPSPADTARILAQAARVLGSELPPIRAERVGLRPFRRTGIRLERDRLRDGRAVIHNYGHGGSGFTLSWGCAHAVMQLAERTL